MTGERQVSIRWSCFFVILCIIFSCTAGENIHDKPLDFEKFFQAIDADGDGEIEQHEAAAAVAASTGLLDMSSNEANDQREGGEDTTMAELLALQNVENEFSYGGSTISASELSDHLQNMLTGEQVVEWVIHGLRLPRYADAFRRNAIVGLDFLTLITDDNKALREDLGVQSLLHQTKIHQSIFRQIFGLGRVPGQPKALECEATPCGSIQLQWDPPTNLGLPPVHKYLVQRRATRSAAWVEVGDPTEDALLDDSNLVLGVPYMYRVQAWGGHGPSEWVTVENCITHIPLEKECSLEGWHVGMNGKPVVPPVSQTVGVSGAVDPLKKDDVEQPKVEGKNGNSHFWSYIYSVNGGLLLIGILARFSFFIRVAMALWTVLLAKVVRKLKLKYAVSQASPYFIIRMFARLVEFVAFCIMWVHAAAKKGIDTIFGTIQPPSTVVVGLSGEDSTKSVQRWWDNDLSTPAEYTWDEMISAVNKTVNKGGNGPSLSRSSSNEQLDIRTTKSEPNLSRSSSEASKSSVDGLRPLFGVYSNGCGGKEEVFRPIETKTPSAEDVRNFSGKGRFGFLQDTEISPTSENDPTRFKQLNRKSRGIRMVGDRSSGSESEDVEEEEESGHQAGLIHGAEIRRGNSGSLVGSQKGRFRCNAGGCNVRFDRWHNITDWRASMSKHYCRDCQGVYCIKHTRISPHGSRGQCGLDSKCLCYSCFARLPVEVQTKLDRLNKLRAGPPVGTLPSSSSGEDNNGGGGGGGGGGHQKFKVAGTVVGWMVGNDHDSHKPATSSISSDDASELKSPSRHGRAPSIFSQRSRSRSRSPLRDISGSESKGGAVPSGNVQRRRGVGGFPENLNINGLNFGSVASSEGSNASSGCDSEEQETSSDSNPGFSFNVSNVKNQAKCAVLQVPTENGEGQVEEERTGGFLRGQSLDSNNSKKAARSLSDSRRKPELSKPGSGPLRPLSPDLGNSKQNTSDGCKMDRNLLPFTTWGSKKLRASCKSPLKSREQSVQAPVKNGERGRVREREFPVNKLEDTTSVPRKDSLPTRTSVIDALAPSLDLWHSEDNNFDGFHVPPVHEMQPLSPKSPNNRIRTIATVSELTEDSDLSTKDSKLRWRMCHMWLLENRGSSVAISVANSSIPPSTGGNRVNSVGTVPLTKGSIGSSSGGNNRSDWGKGKPPRPPPTEAQRRWLKAGRWAIGKELESRGTHSKPTVKPSRGDASRL